MSLVATIEGLRCQLVKWILNGKRSPTARSVPSCASRAAAR
jgi:hypothetical protein